MHWLFGSLMGQIARAILAGLFSLGVLVTRGGWHELKDRKRRKRDEPQLATKDEDRRVDGCGDVVRFFASAYGFIARDTITREELDEKIEAGIEPNDLAQEIHGRIARLPGIILGRQRFNPDIEIKQADMWRERHTYVIGRSGSGKTNLLRTMLQQDFAAGNGVGVLAPEQEFLTEEILPYIPEERINDVVYINPSDTEYPIPINPLYLDEKDDIDLMVDDNLTLFKRLMGDIQPRMEELLRQSLYALLERPGSTLLDIERLLSREDDTLRNEIIRRSNDEQTIRFFRTTYPSFPKDAHLPITTRVSRLVRPRVVRQLLCQPGRSFNFRKVLDEGKILLCNLSDGRIGEQTAQLLGQLIVSKIQLAVFSRTDTIKSERRPFYFYLDEFQTFVGVNAESYHRLLSRSRKYAFGLILAHQQTGQLTRELLREILGNVSTILTFNVSHDDAVRLCSEYIFEMGNESDYLPPEELLRLKVGEAWGKIGKGAFPLKTTLADQRPDFHRAKEVIERSRINYGGRPPDSPGNRPRNAGDDDDPDPSQVF